jgi:predicted nucleic acid-binding protein
LIAKSAWLISLGSQVLVAIDTSVLVAAIVAVHESHAPAKQWLDAIDRRELDALVSTHALAELYGVLTRIRGGLSPEEAQLTVGNLPNRMRVTPLTTGAYMTAVERCSARARKSGAVFDALHLIAAERARADALLTFNPGDFTRLAQGERPKIVVPSASPAELMPTISGTNA